MELYITQGLLVITLDTGVDLANAEEPKIVAQSPSGARTEFDAEVIEGTKLRYSFEDTDIVQAGTWKFQAKFEIDGRTAYGQVVQQVFKQKL